MHPAGPMPCGYAAACPGLCKAGSDKDEVKAVWFYARAWDFAPAAYKAQIEPQLDYWYKRFHGTLDGDAAITQQIDAIKSQAQATLFPPATFPIAPAPTPADLAHHAYTSGDPKALSLEDKEYILANGSDADATGLWALLKGQPTPVPGIVIADPHRSCTSPSPPPLRSSPRITWSSSRIQSLAPLFRRRPRNSRSRTPRPTSWPTASKPTPTPWVTRLPTLPRTSTRSPSTPRSGRSMWPLRRTPRTPTPPTLPSTSRTRFPAS